MAVICDQDFTKILMTPITKVLSNCVLLIKILYFEHSGFLDISIEIEDNFAYLSNLDISILILSFLVFMSLPPSIVPRFIKYLGP